MRIPYYEDFQNEYIHLSNNIIGQDVAFATTTYVDSKLNETNNRARRSINEHTDIMRKDLEHTFASRFVYNNFYEIHRTGRFNASSEVSPDNSFLGIPYSIFTVSGSNAKVAQIHMSALNINIGSRYTLRFLIRSQTLKNITFGFEDQNSTDHTLTYEFKIIESTATHSNISKFNVVIDLSSLSVGETVEIAALYIEALNTSDQINENIDLKFQHKVINSDNPTNEYDLVTKNYVDGNINNNTIVRNNKNNNFNNKLLMNIRYPEADNDAASKMYVDMHNNIVYNNKENNMNGNKITNIGNPINANDAVRKEYVDNDTTIVRNNRVNNFNNNIISNIGYPQNDKDAVCKSYIDDNVKTAILTHPYILKYQLENIFASPHIFINHYKLKYNEFPFDGGHNATSYTVNDISFLGEKYERYKCTNYNSYTMHIQKGNLPGIKQNKTYKMIFIMRGVNSSIDKQVGLGIWKETGQSQKFSLLKESWSLEESDEVVNNVVSFNFFLYYSKFLLNFYSKYYN